VQLGLQRKAAAWTKRAKAPMCQQGRDIFPGERQHLPPALCLQLALYLQENQENIDIYAHPKTHTYIYAFVSFRLRMCIPADVRVLTCVNQRMCVLPTFTRVKDDLSFVLPVTLSRISFRSFSGEAFTNSGL
jgi:hypothetical protein